MIAELLGQRERRTTSRYARPASDPALAAADRVVGEIAAGLASDVGAEVVDLSARR